MTLDPVPDRLSDDTLAYRRALGSFATGVCVVTAHSANGPLGMTINSFTSVSLEPRLVLWCLDEQSERWPAFSAAEHFAIHVLGAEDRARAERFAKGIWSLAPEDYLDRPDAAPCLPDVLCRLDCRTHRRIPMGDHMILVGEVQTFQARDGEALTFWRGRYGS